MNPETEKINMGYFLLALEKTGLKRSDPRLKELIQGLKELHRNTGDKEWRYENIDVDFDTFQKLIEKNLVLISQVFSQKLVIPDFVNFCAYLTDIFGRCQQNTKVINVPI